MDDKLSYETMKATLERCTEKELLIAAVMYLKDIKDLLEPEIVGVDRSEPLINF